MKLSYKILLSSLITMALALGIGGYFFVNNVFKVSIRRETGLAMDESSILQFAFETAALNTPAKYGRLQDSVVEEIGASLEKSGQRTGRLLRISDENRELLYASEGFAEDRSLLSVLKEGTKAYQVLRQGEDYYIQTGIVITTLDRMLYLETMRDVTAVYEERDRGFAVYRNITLLILAFSSVFMYFISYWITRPIRILTEAARRMTAGDYGYRAEQVSHDEMGQITSDFNYMAEALEANIRRLEEEIRAREDFIAAFSHELKTPLTTVIGYADMLRSKKLSEEKHFLSANYIYTEGKRLEAMSLRLLDIIVTKRCEIELKEVKVSRLFAYLQEIYAEQQDYDLIFQYQDGLILADADLLKTVLLNLADNACKASKPGGRIEFLGEETKSGYAFAVRDYGVGIPKEELKKITEAFYMVDKSRSRSKNGAGLGLALCVEILKLHKSSLEIESREEEGSCFRFVIPKEEVGEDESGE